MSVYFADSSAAAKRYITEKGSSWVRSWTDPNAGNIVIVSELASVEVRKVLTTLHLKKALSTYDAVLLRNDFLLHFRNEYFVIGIDSALLDEAANLTRKHALTAKYILRSLDAIQLACTLRARNAINAPIIFVSGDNRLREAAKAESFITDNPELYP